MIFPGDGGHLRLIGQRGGVYDAVASMVRALRVQWLRALRVWPRRDVGCWVWKVLLEACSDMFRFVFPFEELCFVCTWSYLTVYMRETAQAQINMAINAFYLCLHADMGVLNNNPFQARQPSSLNPKPHAPRTSFQSWTPWFSSGPTGELHMKSCPTWERT